MESDVVDDPPAEKPLVGRKQLESWLNKSLKIQMTDGRTLIGVFVCTDRECNIILGSCQEFLHYPEEEGKEEPRMLGLALIPGRHVVCICIDTSMPL